MHYCIVNQNNTYLYQDVQAECLLGSRSDVNAQLVLKTKDSTIDVDVIKVKVTAASTDSAVIVDGAIEITYIAGVTTYATLQTVLSTNVDIAANFYVLLPGTGSGLVSSQNNLKFEVPIPAEIRLDKGGVFYFNLPGPDVTRSYSVPSGGVHCGSGSVSD